MSSWPCVGTRSTSTLRVIRIREQLSPHERGTKGPEDRPQRARERLSS
jgi:hypothetical protein